jgi:DNA-binding HxlR family transcriptional regulator
MQPPVFQNPRLQPASYQAQYARIPGYQVSLSHVCSTSSPTPYSRFAVRYVHGLLRALQRPEFNLRGLRRADLIALLPELSPAALSRELRRLRLLGLIKRVAGTYRYYLTRLGRAAIAAACSIIELKLIPALATAT